MKHGFSVDWARKERLLSPLLFAATMLILFSIAVGEVEPTLIPKVFLAQLFLTCLFALQLALSRTFEADQKDAIFSLLSSYPLNRSAWFFGKWTIVFVQSVLITLPTSLIAAIFNQNTGQSLLHFEIFGLLLLAIAALCSIGVLLSGLTLHAQGKEILFPILYFPLSVPVLIASVQGGNSFFYDPIEVSTLSQWTLLLSGFAIIYTTLGFLLFSELVD